MNHALGYTPNMRGASALIARLLLATAFLIAAQPGRAQDLRTLTIRIVIDDAGQQTPVPRYRLLVSDSPPTAAPRVATTGPDGTATIRVRPGRYTVESDQAVALNGKSYEWFQEVNVAAGQDATLSLTEANAEIGGATASTATVATPGGAPAVDDDPRFLAPRWRNSVVTIWTELARGSGFVVDGKGLVVAPQRLIGTAAAVEVQLSPTVKVTGQVIKSDKPRDVAVLRIEPSILGAVPPVPLECGAPATSSPLAEGQDIFALGIAYRQSTEMTDGTISRLDPRRLGSTITLRRGSAGGPVFGANGHLVGMSIAAEDEDSRSARAQVIRTVAICEAVAEAEPAVNQTALPSPARLPVESAAPPPIDGLKAAVERRAGSLSPYKTASPGFDVALITPLMTYGPQYQADRMERRAASGTTQPRRREMSVVVPPILDFQGWSEYAADFPPVLLVRVTPKQVEGLWKTVARGAAYTQGVALPSMKRAGPSFARMNAYCGSTEVVPVHPFKIEQRISETEAIAEGLYAYPADAFGPQCADVRFELYSEKAPEKAEPLAIGASLVQQIWQDFAPYRAAAPAAK